MSCNNYVSYASCYGYPTSYACYSRTNYCAPQCNPCPQVVIACPPPCNPCNPCPSPCNPCPSPCNPCNPCNPCPPCNPCSPCATIAYITNAQTQTTIPTGTVGVAPTPIPAGSTVIPAGTVTPLTGFTGNPSTNCGGITVNPSNGQFTIPCAGRYTLSIFVGFSANAVGTREVYIYRIDASTGVISLLVSDSRNATSVGPTNVTISTSVDLNANDRIFFAVTQNSGSTLTTTETRAAIVRLC